MYLSEEQEIFFKGCILKSIYEDDMSLPAKLELNKVYKLVYYKYVNRGCRDLRFVVSNSNSTFFVDYYFITDDYSSHMRIDQKGHVMELENYEGQFGWPVLSTEEETEKEHERIRLHNQIVHSILISKGLEDKINVV